MPVFAANDDRLRIVFQAGAHPVRIATPSGYWCLAAGQVLDSISASLEHEVLDVPCTVYESFRDGSFNQTNLPKTALEHRSHSAWQQMLPKHRKLWPRSKPSFSNSFAGAPLTAQNLAEAIRRYRGESGFYNERSPSINDEYSRAQQALQQAEIRYRNTVAMFNSNSPRTMDAVRELSFCRDRVRHLEMAQRYAEPPIQANFPTKDSK